ncbi:MAG: sigma-70 family RNA polymerase sigma factor [Planctomycetota bacterium]|jgi:RNA polymerase sigma factor (sigma-70 family)|nr:sigma-70 family RNA polymerase sigma factor [Planctomycetota bacterium]MDP6763745.1 sigma-70 family RNA polymerase sigma factor [Planctomycetota bacterium]MDP6989229.1 sigma-70 family RNA polymerase sigma factor [Planctomycetota bacterium]
MQAIDPYSSGLDTLGEEVLQRIGSRMGELGGEVGKREQAAIAALLRDTERTLESRRDAASTRLMEAFRHGRGRGSFGLLYELNGQHLFTQVLGRLRRYGSHADPRDVLQEVFFNIYRYPHRFNASREDAFRVWSAMIVRNTVLKHLRSNSRGGRNEVNFDELPDQPNEKVQSPLGGAIESESTDECARVYVTYLQLYLKFYSMLSERERRALHLVEVEDRSYREAAAALEIKLENLKMVIFRARRKIHRSMRRVFDGLSPDCRPARDPQAEASARSGGVDVERGGLRASGSDESIPDRDLAAEEDH